MVNWNEDGGLPMIILVIISCIFPLVGLVFYFIFKGSRPQTAKYCTYAFIFCCIVWLIGLLAGLL